MSKYFWLVYYYFFPTMTLRDYALQLYRCSHPVQIPCVTYNKRGKFYTLWMEDEESYCERYDDNIDVYKSCKTGKVTGYKIYE